VRWEALACWLVASLLARYTGFLLTDAIEGLVAGTVLYGVIGSVMRVRRQGGAASAQPAVDHA
jgi:cytosine permease